MDKIIRGFTLGEPTQILNQLDKDTLIKKCQNTFNNCDFCGTITLKGSNKIRLLQSNLKQQFIFFQDIKEILDTYCKYYCINYELHTCGEWLHSHFIFRPIHRSKVPQMRKEIYLLITGHSLRKKSYRHRILLEKPYNIHNYIKYMFKEYDSMEIIGIHSNYKLFSNPIICQKAVLTTKREEEKTITTQNIDKELPVLINT